VISGERTLAFVIACVAIILAPGPSVMFVVARAVAWGRATAWLTALGNAFGMLALSVVIALGLGPLFQRSALLLAIVQGLGGLYLIWLGIDALRHRRAHVDAMVTVDEEKPSLWQVIRQGFMVGILNPKALVFFSAVFPQFVEPASGSVTVQLLIFGLIFAVLSVLLDGMWAIVVGSSRDWFVTSDKRLLVLRTVGGVVMIVLGVLVLIPLIWSVVSGA